ncbi:MerR family transcriptional regulator [Streptomyces sp. NBC_01236]|uniref:MerR family transcriptional regulator n=1 Tax=Streptomyces sp. NBC_01236 TaxID=2903789 RepID=UPI002E1637CD|nr:MerR family transcriptional regulator [Streptomyces sp. NBC_01236]
MKIGELSGRASVSQRSLRYYEEQGLLTPTRLPNGYRDYDERAVTTVRRIQILLAAGLGTSAIAEILPCAVDDTVVLSGKCPELIDGLAKERQRINTTIDDLIAARDILDSLIGRPLHTQTARSR